MNSEIKNSYFIKNATLVNEGRQKKSNVLVVDGIISAVDVEECPGEDFITENNIDIFDAEGLMLIPGVIDDQVHFRDPGLTHKGDILTESSAAIAGGITSFMEMPNTNPQTITNTLLEEKYNMASAKSKANYSFYLGATNDNIDEIKKFDPSKNPGIKVFMGASTGNMLVDNPEVLEKIFSTPFLIAIHSEHEATIQKNIAFYKQQFGEDVPVSYHPLIRSEEACYLSTLQAVSIARRKQTRLHVLHLSTSRELDLLKSDFPLSEKKITTEVCVHHLWFNDSAYLVKGNLIKWNPAIKTETDRKALFDAIVNNEIDIVATDHAPHTLEEKQKSYFSCPSGGPLVQHSLQVMLEFVNQGKLSLQQVVDLMCHKPAICFKVQRRGFIRKDYFADLVLLDLNSKTTVDKSSLLYKCGWSPFEGHTFHSQVKHTFVNGVLVYSNHIVNPGFFGKRLDFNS